MSSVMVSTVMEVEILLGLALTKDDVFVSVPTIVWSVPCHMTEVPYHMTMCTLSHKGGTMSHDSGQCIA